MPFLPGEKMCSGSDDDGQPGVFIVSFIAESYFFQVELTKNVSTSLLMILCEDKD